MKNAIIFLLVLFLFVPGGLNAQSNAFLDEFLKETKAQAGKSIYLVLSVSGIIDEASSVDNALGFILDKKWNISFKNPDDAITLGEFSYIVMKALDIGGGLMYGIFPGPFYACKELAYHEYIKGIIDPSRPISGNEAYSILRRVIESKENAQ
jgi:hypothetical protein